uniref:VIT domain-containing protein n=1 Tax=Sinocyclocheilus grahami TaxID=75366 RepID=A0A672M978_SINGR
MPIDYVKQSFSTRGPRGLRTTLSLCDLPLCVFIPSVFQIEVQSMKVDCKVTSRFTHTVMTTKALNKANISQEVSFEVELPKTSFITNFSMSIDGKTYTGVVKEKEKAKQQYQKAVSSGQTAGLVEKKKFSVSVNVAADSSVKFILTREELLQRLFGKYELMIRVKPKQLVQHFEVHY